MRRELNAVACSVRKDSPDSFALLIASAETKPKEVHEFKIGDRHAKLSVEYGDFSDVLKKAADALAEVGIGSADKTLDSKTDIHRAGEEVRR